MKAMSFNHKRASRILMGMIEDKDPVTSEHSRNVARLAVRLGEACGLKGRKLRHLEFGALLHDADKLKVPDEIFLKLRSGSGLSKEDVTLLVEHSSIQGTYPYEGKMPQYVEICQKLHHENYDGSGSPKGLSGEQIPLAVRILQVVDTYDAYRLNLPGHKGQTKSQALANLKQLSGTVLDPQLTEQFIKIMKKNTG